MKFQGPISDKAANTRIRTVSSQRVWQESRIEGFRLKMGQNCTAGERSINCNISEAEQDNLGN